MIKIEMGQLQPNTPFMSVFSKVSRYDKFGTKTLYRLTKLARKLNKEMRTIADLRMKLVNEYAQKDESGKFIPMMNEKGEPIPNTFTIPDALQEEWGKKMEEFQKTEIEIDLDPIPLNLVKDEGFNISTQEALILEPILSMEE